MKIAPHVDGKLSGDVYLSYWRDRIAKGPTGVARRGFNAEQTAAQADLFFAFMKPVLEDLDPVDIMEFGCGYGRMMRRMRGQFPGASLYGVDLCPEAIAQGWRDEKTMLEVGHTVPDKWVAAGMGLIYSFTVVQHITDNAIFHDVTRRIAETLRPGGCLVMLENVSLPKGRHMRECTAGDYKAAFPSLDWRPEAPELTHAGERHALLVGRRPL